MTPAGHEAELRQQAEAAIGRRDWQTAAGALKKLIALYPGHAALLVQLSYVESYCGHYQAAREAALLAARHPTSDVEVASDVLARLRTFNEPIELHGYLRRLGPLSRLPIRVLLVAAAQLSYLNDQSGALALQDIARNADPDYPGTLLSRAQVLMYLGRFEESRKELDRVRRRAPEIAQTYLLLSQLGRQADGENHVASIRKLLQSQQLRSGEAIQLWFALHKELADAGDVSGAWSALLQGCKLKRSSMSYQPEQTRQIVSGLESLPPPKHLNARLEGPIPIFIVGMHRSGTTLTEQLLDGHRDIGGVGELYDFTSQMRYATDHHCKGVIDLTIVERSREVDFADVGGRYLTGMQWRLGQERFFTDKLPSNFLNIGFICQALPQAKILHMVRDPIETCFSNLRELFSDANPYSYDQLELADFYKQYRRLMAHWHQAYPGRILDVDYAELTRDTETVLRRVSAFCGFDFEPEMLALQNRKRGVATASAVQVRDKVVVREQPKWKPYEQYLQPLIQALRADGFVQ